MRAQVITGKWQDGSQMTAIPNLHSAHSSSRYGAGSAKALVD